MYFKQDILSMSSTNEKQINRSTKEMISNKEEDEEEECKEEVRKCKML